MTIDLIKSKLSTALAPERLEIGGSGNQAKSKIQADFTDDPFEVIPDINEDSDDGMHKY